MGWERRARGGRYYTRSRKVDGRVIREYVGTGPLAEAMAEIEQARRSERQAETLERRDRDKRLDAAEAPLDDFCRMTEALARGALLLAGFRRHNRGEWRKTRERKAADDGAPGRPEPDGAEGRI
jgi:hypothetical protein